MVAVDLLWIGVIANGFYRTELAALYSPQLVWQAAVLFYILYALGLSYFVITPGVAARKPVLTMVNAAFFALVAYATYDLTSLSITVGWPVLLTVVDMAWGIFIGVFTSILTYGIARRFFDTQ